MRIHYTFLYVRASLGILLKKDVKKGWQMMIRSHSVDGQASRTGERYLYFSDVFDPLDIKIEDNKSFLYILKYWSVPVF